MRKAGDRAETGKRHRRAPHVGQGRATNLEPAALSGISNVATMNENTEFNSAVLRSLRLITTASPPKLSIIPGALQMHDHRIVPREVDDPTGQS